MRHRKRIACGLSVALAMTLTPGLMREVGSWRSLRSVKEIMPFRHYMPSFNALRGRDGETLTIVQAEQRLSADNFAIIAGAILGAAIILSPSESNSRTKKREGQS